MPVTSLRDLKPEIDASTMRRERSVANHRREQALSRLRLALFVLVSAIVMAVSVLTLPH